MKNNLPPNWKGKRHSLETRKRMSEFRLLNPSPGMRGKKHSTETKKKMSELRRGIVFSEETKKKMSFAKLGEKAPTWKGGITKLPEYTAFHSRQRRLRKLNAFGFHAIEEWKLLKKKFNFSCVNCGKREPEIKLEADHIIPLAKNGTDYIENIQPLCRICNAIKGAKIIIRQPITV